MDFYTFSTEFSTVFQTHSISLQESQMRQYYSLLEHLMTVNEHTNLTAIRDENGIVLKHFVDSMMLSPYLSEGATVLDMGCGAGFPTLPLAILRPDLNFIPMDSTGKKIQFVQEAIEKCGLTNVNPVCGRCEDTAILRKYKGVDFVVSRSMAELRILAEMGLPYLKIGDTLLAMKSVDVEAEIDLARKTIEILGGDSPKTVQYVLHADGEEIPHAIVFVKKIAETPAKYPRQFAQIKAKPLS